jgi:hypothetical protein
MFVQWRRRGRFNAEDAEKRNPRAQAKAYATYWRAFFMEIGWDKMAGEDD